MLYFELKNVRVFRENAIFQAIPNKVQTKNKELYIQKLYKDKPVDLLPFSVIYGGNASGKSTIIKSMELFREIILSGRIYTDDPRNPLFNIGLYPFLHDYSEYQKPLQFGIGFIHNNHKYEYSLTIEFTMPRQEYYVERKIIEEKLIIDDKIKYVRDTEKIVIDNKEKIIGKEEAINENELYLYGSFKSNIENNTHFSNIFEWFRNKFIIITSIEDLNFTIETNLFMNSVRLGNEFIDATSNMADYGPQKLYYMLSNDPSTGARRFQMRALYNVANYIGQQIETNAVNTESSGTIKLVDITSLLIGSIVNGATLVIDELDSSFHFGLITEIIKLFKNKEINKKGAQLIFTSHNPTFMSLTDIRKDQVYFVEKNNITHTSELYSLTDFKTNTKNDVRNGEEFIKNYLSGKYGALPKFDFENTIVKCIQGIINSNDKRG